MAGEATQEINPDVSLKNMEDYETLTKQGKLEKRVFIDSGKFVIYGYELNGKLTNKSRILLKGEKKRSLFIINTGKGRNLAVDAEYEDEVFVLRDGKPLRVSEELI